MGPCRHISMFFGGQYALVVLFTAAAQDGGNLDCWSGADFSFSVCCAHIGESYGNPSCWNLFYNYYRCCFPNAFRDACAVQQRGFPVGTVEGIYQKVEYLYLRQGLQLGWTQAGLGGFYINDWGMASRGTCLSISISWNCFFA